jgi:4-amino-4-deoxy-L-arabinose transferase-like glycosyltransferase
VPEGVQAVEHSVESDDVVGADAPTAGRASWRRRLQFWRSPTDQPAWARPALLIVAALCALSYAWNINNTPLEPFYGSAARSMSESWHNFIFGAVDPWGTVSVDKLPGALWVQALSLRIFGFHVWAIVLPQVIEGTLTVLVLYRVVRRVANPLAGLIAALVMASSPIVILLDHGNISDSLLILLLVLAADAATRAYLTGRLRSLVWAGVLVGFAFQTKMLQAWLVLPPLYLAYFVAAPAASWLRRLGHVLLSAVAVVVVSLSWMTSVSLVPSADRPYVDGSCNNSVFSQVFDYNGLSRLGPGLGAQHGCHPASPELIALARSAARTGYNTGAIGPAADRLLHGVFGHDDAWLLLPTIVALAALLIVQRKRPRTDAIRAAVLLWSTWLLILFGFFSAGIFINSYYVAALVPAMAALLGLGGALAWERRRVRRVRVVVAATAAATVTVTIALVPGYAGVRNWVVAFAVAAGLLGVGVLLASLRRGHDSVWAVTVGPVLAVIAMLMGTAWASGVVVSQGLGSFNSPYEPAGLNQETLKSVTDFNLDVPLLAQFVSVLPSSSAADVFETSQAAGFDILATGREFLPVGGFTGVVPAPTVSQFERLVAQGRISRATVTTQPLTRSPVLLWVMDHCRRVEGIADPGPPPHTNTVYQCTPQDAP